MMDAMTLTSVVGTLSHSIPNGVVAGLSEPHAGSYGECTPVSRTLWTVVKRNGRIQAGRRWLRHARRRTRDWEVTAQVGEREDSKMTFVTRVVKIGEGPPRWDPRNN